MECHAPQELISEGGAGERLKSLTMSSGISFLVAHTDSHNAVPKTRSRKKEIASCIRLPVFWFPDGNGLIWVFWIDDVHNRISKLCVAKRVSIAKSYVSMICRKHEVGTNTATVTDFY